MAVAATDIVFVFGKLNFQKIVRRVEVAHHGLSPAAGQFEVEQR
jgi:hypothetical protein